MKIKANILPLFTVCTGILGVIFRFWLETSGTDKNGLMRPGHLSLTLILLTMAATLLVLFLCARGAAEQNTPLPRSIPGSIGCFIGGVGILIANLMELDSASDVVAILSVICGFIGAAALAYMGICRYKGTPAHILSYVGLMLFFMLHLIMQYRKWSATPELQDYFFPLLGSIFLMLCAYHRGCKDLLKKDNARFVFFNQAALFCCFLSLNGNTWPFYATMGLWTVLDLPFPRKEA